MKYWLLSRLMLGVAVGLGGGVGLGLVLTLAHVIGPAKTTANASGGTVTACVSVYTGGVRMGYPGQSLKCTTSEFPVELGAGDPAENLTYVVRTGGTVELLALGSSGSVIANCEAGETAISGGVDFQDASGGAVFGFGRMVSGTFPLDSPPTGWRSRYDYEDGPFPGAFAVGWVLCVS